MGRGLLSTPLQCSKHSTQLRHLIRSQLVVLILCGVGHRFNAFAKGRVVQGE